MSMISAQIDELRKWADQLSERENEFGVVVRALVAALRDAADTIWQLRDDLQQANAENAKLRTQLADVTESMGRVDERCAKLRELVRALLTCATNGECDECRMNGATPWHVGEAQLCDGIWEHLRELGVEVDG